MKRTLILLLILLLSQFSFSQTTLTAGDIAIIGYHADTPDQFAFVVLVNIDSGTQISFTDNGVHTDGSIRTGEGTTLFTASTAYSAGTVFLYENGNLDAQFSNQNLAMSSGGDQVIAYQGSEASPTYIYAINSEGTGWQADATSSNTSALPTGLVDGESAIALSEIDNSTYDESTLSGTQEDLLAEISNTSNWSGSNSTLGTLSFSSFTVTSSSGGGSFSFTLSPSSSNRTLSQADISFTTSDTASSVLFYTTDTLSTPDSLVFASVNRTQFDTTLVSLSAKTRYFFKARAANADTTIFSSWSNFTTDSLQFITGPRLKFIRETTAEVEFSTNYPVIGTLYIDDASFNNFGSATSSFTDTITALTKSTSYNYRFDIVDENHRDSIQEANHSFSTIDFATVPTTGVFFSEYIEGSSNNKAIEVYNASGMTINLKNYVVALSNNGSSTPGNSLIFESDEFLAHDSVYVIANSSADPLILNASDTSSTVTFFNGDDAIALYTRYSFDASDYSRLEMIDAIGEVGVDPGTAWTDGSYSTANKTLRRKSSVITGSTPSPFNPSVEWDLYDNDTFDGLGKHNQLEFTLNPSALPSNDSLTISFESNLSATALVRIGVPNGIWLDSSTVSVAATAFSVPFASLQYDSLYSYSVTITKDGSSESITSTTATIRTDSAALVVTDLSSTVHSDSTATIYWATNYNSNAKVLYRNLGSVDFDTTAVANNVLSDSLLLIGLAENTSYEFKVIVTGGSSETAISDLDTLMTPYGTLHYTVNPNANTIGITTATISFETNRPSTAVVRYGNASIWIDSVLVTSSQTNFSANLTNLQADSLYQFSVTVEADGDTITSTSDSFKTFPEDFVISTEPYASNRAVNSVTLKWATNYTDTSIVMFGTDSNYTLGTFSNILTDSIKITGLSEKTNYLAKLITYYQGDTLVVKNINFATHQDVNAGDVVISEIMYDSEGDDVEWIELHNTTTDSIDLGSWYITDDDTYPATGEGDFVIAKNVVIAPDSFLVFIWNDTGLVSISNEIIVNKLSGYRTSAPTLGNSGDNIALYSDSTGTGFLIDGSQTVKYTDAAGGNVGASIERNVSNNYADAWSASTNFINDSQVKYGTPAAKNSNQFLSFVSEPSVAAITTDSVVISFTSNFAATAVIRYGLTSTYTDSITVSTAATSFSETISSLTEETLYHFNVTITKDGDTEHVTSSDDSFTTASNALAFTANPTATNITDTTAQITWSSNHSSTAVLRYGLSSAYTDSIVISSASVSGDQILNSLAANTTYHFNVTLTKDADTETITSSDANFTTTNIGSAFDGGITAAIAATVGDTITVEGWINSKGDISGSSNRGTFYMQDDLAGFAIYWSSGSDDFLNNVSAGQRVSLTGTRGDFHGLLQINPTSYTITDASIKVLTPKEISISDLGNYQSQLVQINDIVSIDPADTSWGADQNYTITSNSVTAQMRIEDGTDIDGTSVGIFPKDIIGIVGHFDSPQLQPRSLADIIDGFGFTSNPSTSNLDTSSVRIDFTASASATAVIRYGLTSAYTDSISVSSAATSFSETISGLSENTTYHFNATIYADGSSESATSSDDSFTTKSAASLGTIFPGLYGEELKDSLRASYYMTGNLGYDNARDELFGVVDNYNDTVVLVYTGDKLPLLAGSGRPSTSSTHVNTEHNWPQSKGADSHRKYDIHSLFPTYEGPNGARSSNPFDELDDDTETTKWWISNSSISSKPSSNIDDYSESSSSAFEPREVHKGNVARAMMYFYTMYEDEGIDIAWFTPQIETLRAWNLQDPVDSRELERTARVKAAQGNDNPFILDPTLVDRIFGEAPSILAFTQAAAVIPKDTFATVTWTTNLAATGYVIYGTDSLNLDSIAVSSTSSGSELIENLNPETNYLAYVWLTDGNLSIQSDTLHFTTLEKDTSISGGSGGLIISEVVDGPFSGGKPKILELTNTSSSAINMNNYVIHKYTNGGTTPSNRDTLSSFTLPAGESVVFTNADAAEWASYSLGTPSHIFYSFGAADNNGDDVYEVVSDAGAVVDIYGELGVDGTGTAWEFLDSYAIRNTDILSGNSTFTLTEWTIAAPNTLDGHTADLATFITPGTHEFGGVANLKFTASPSVSAVGLDSALVSFETNHLSTAVLRYGTSTTYSDSIVINSADTNFTLAISGLAENTLYHYNVSITKDGDNESVSSDDATFTTLSSSLIFTSIPAAENITDSTALITWTSNFASTAVVRYGLTNAYTDSISVSTAGTNGNVALESLFADTIYHFNVSITKEGSAESITSIDSSFQTLQKAASDGALIISEVVDGPFSGGKPKILELTNTSSSAINMNNYVIHKYTNGATTPSNRDTISSFTLPAGESVVFTNASDEAEWLSYGLSAPAHIFYAYGPADNNGDDVYEVVSDAGAVVDIYGELGVDGTGTAWEFLDSYAFRNSNIAKGSSTFDVSEWTIAAPNTLDGHTSDFATFVSPGSHIFIREGDYTFTSNPVATNITFTTADISFAVTDSSTAIVRYGTSATYSDSVEVSTASKSFAVSLTGLTANTDYHFNVTISKDGGSETKTSDDATFKTQNDQTTAIADIVDNFSAYNNQAVTIEGILLNDFGNLQETRTNIYISDANGKALNLSSATLYEDLKRGDRVRLTGTVSEFSDVYQIDPSSAPNVLESNASLPTPIDATTAQIANISHHGNYIKVFANVVSIVATGTSGTNIVINDGSGEATVRVWSTTGIDLSSISVGTSYYFRGGTGTFSGAGQLLPSVQDDISLTDIKPPPSSDRLILSHQSFLYNPETALANVIRFNFAFNQSLTGNPTAFVGISAQTVKENTSKSLYYLDYNFSLSEHDETLEFTINAKDSMGRDTSFTSESLSIQVASSASKSRKQIAEKLALEIRPGMLTRKTVFLSNRMEGEISSDFDIVSDRIRLRSSVANQSGELQFDYRSSLKDPKKLSFYRYDLNQDEWLKVPSYVTGDYLTSFASSGDYVVMYDEDQKYLPQHFSLHQNYPNPFNPNTTIRFDLTQNQHVRLIIYNALGQRIRTLVNSTLEAGEAKVEWKGLNDLGRKVPSGIYFYQIITSQQIVTKKMILLK